MSQERADLYAVLGVNPSATQDENRRAYRDLLRRHHPDTRALHNPTQPAAASEDALQKVFAAYTMLSDPVRRARYDQQRAGRSRQFSARPQAPTARQDGPPDQPSIQAGPVHWHLTDGANGGPQGGHVHFEGHEDLVDSTRSPAK